MAYHILRHIGYESASRLLPDPVRRKADWAIVQLGSRGRTPSTKGTIGLNAAWRRSPVQGSHYYLWWIPAAESGIPLNGHTPRDGAPSILVHSIRHHDETDQPLNLGQAGDYEPLDVGLLDPRFADQEEIAVAAQAATTTFTVLEGMPGSGKSVALMFLARDLATRPGVHKVRYVTYTDRLKRAGREIFDALGPEISQHITVHTVNDVVRQLVGAEVASSPYGDIGYFLRELEVSSPSQLGEWKAFPYSLYTELRAHIIGRTFPPHYHLPRHRDEQLRRTGGEIDVVRYGRSRKLDARSAEQAVALANRLQGRLFVDQMLAARALEILQGGACPRWLADTDAFIVDEVQDLTLLQIALIGEMSAARLQKLQDRPFALTIAGDESQIVQPTGFKWGVTKDLLSDRLHVHPLDYRFVAQRRSPPVLARIAGQTWSLYSRLPKDLRPSAGWLRDAELDAAEREAADNALPEGGLVIVAAPPATTDFEEWRPILTELVDRPGRALIDLTESLTEHVTDSGLHASMGEVIFPAREIKGLERGTVLVHGLNATYQRIVDLTSDEHGERIAQMEARRLIDQVRVALTRSTGQLVLLEPANAPVLVTLRFDVDESALQLEVSELVELLQGEQMTDVEMIIALLDEAEDLAERGRLPEALARNRRAAALAHQTQSMDTLRQIELQEVEFLLSSAEGDLAAGRIANAMADYQSAGALLDGQASEETLDRLKSLGERLNLASDSEFERLLNDSALALRDVQYEQSVAAAERALRLSLGSAQEYAAELGEGRLTRARTALLNARSLWADALAARDDPSDSPAIATLFNDSASLLAESGVPHPRNPYTVLARRYHECPQRSAHSMEQVRLLVETARSFLESAESAPVNPVDYFHVLRCLEEAYADLGNNVDLFFAWTDAAARLARRTEYAPLDERIWDLENRYHSASPQARSDGAAFAALLAGYNGDHGGASAIWESLGETDRAVAAARAAGDLERSHALLRQYHRPIPEDLATALKAVRLLQQLRQKHQGLTGAERLTLVEELALLHTEITGEAAPDENE